MRAVDGSGAVGLFAKRLFILEIRLSVDRFRDQELRTIHLFRASTIRRVAPGTLTGCFQRILTSGRGSLQDLGRGGAVDTRTNRASSSRSRSSREYGEIVSIRNSLNLGRRSLHWLYRESVAIRMGARLEAVRPHTIHFNWTTIPIEMVFRILFTSEFRIVQDTMKVNLLTLRLMPLNLPSSPSIAIPLGRDRAANF